MIRPKTVKCADCGIEREVKSSWYRVPERCRKCHANRIKKFGWGLSY